MTITVMFVSLMVLLVLSVCYCKRHRLRRTFCCSRNQRRARIEVIISIPKPTEQDRWEVKHDEKGRVYYVDHLNQTSTWIEPAELAKVHKELIVLDNNAAETA